jgi:hypothetical protein
MCALTYVIGDFLKLRNLKSQAVWITQVVNVVGITDDVGEMIARGIFDKTQTEEAACTVKFGDVRVQADFVRDGLDGLFQLHARHACGFSDDLGAESIGVLSVLKGDQVTRGIIGDAIALDVALPPRRALTLKFEPHLTKEEKESEIRFVARLRGVDFLLPHAPGRRTAPTGRSVTTGRVSAG